MAIDTDNGRLTLAYDGTATPLKTALFLLVCAAWLLPGLVGHDPWKYDEAVVFGAMLEAVRSGDWLTFQIAGEPFIARGPLFIWVAAACAKLFGGLLPVHDAARLAAGLFTALTLASLWMASFELMGERVIRLSVLLLIGCLGLLIRAHEMSADLAGLAGVTLGMYGIALGQRRERVGGIVAGLGIAVAFLGAGFVPAGLLVALLAALPATSPLWRTRGHAVSAVIALAVAAPLVIAWPVAVANAAPAWFSAWRESATVPRWQGQGDPLDAIYFLRILPWYTWPAWPLAAWTLWRSRRSLLSRRELMFPLTAFIVFFAGISVFAEPRDVSAMVLLPPLAILGVAELDNLPRGAASALDWFGMTTFFLFAAIVWVGWVAAVSGVPQFATAWLAAEVPGYRYQFHFVSVALAALLSLIWLVVAARSLRSSRRALVNWAAGITMVWMLVMTLGLPLVDQARSYRAISARLISQLPAHFTCIARRNVGDAQRALLDYFAGIRTIREDMPAAKRCEVLLVQASPLHVPPVQPPWSEAWRGSRPGDRHELFIVYRR